MIFNKDVTGIEISGIRKFYNMIADKENVISLTIGQPDFPTPEHIKNAAKEAIDNNFTSYSHNAGYIELRKAVSMWMKNKYNLQYNAENEITVHAGSSQALDVAFRAILNPGDEVILPAPIYPGYEPLIKLSKATPVLVDTTDSDFKITPELIETYMTKKTKAVVIPYPSNPTGAVLSESETAELALYLKDKDLFVISDELYSELVFDSNHYSIAGYPNMKKKTIIITGLSKSHSMTGWRLGVALSSKPIIEQMIKVHQYNIACATTISQKAGIQAYTHGYDDALPMKEAYQRRMENAYQRLTKLGLELDKPKGTFYMFPKVPFIKSTSFDLALDIVNKVGVALVPGTAFSKYGEGYLRLSCACSDDELEEGLYRLEKYFKRY
jgi:aminotransferase